ncbi:ATP-binding protein [Cellulosilyticum lentocellum]|uniref:AAA+ ATPase domain-containing protein n=1 Tax=Cellulosilyticum lentocellum (strain ATCC 49066 / DSM 5427 / NCIMB 11756 / RHM5) TaxID=642492 RepID=F2JQ85_CELLD|nr:ATP-binding protein [Cellulosilyticum lentocellum]ADZ83747.1 protein of unknown function DUF815 [Cellulosilyticum lentocellum DSM 5427]
MQFIFYRRLNEIAILKGAQTLQEEKNEVLYQKILGELLEQSYHLKLGQDLFKMYLCFLVANDENAFSLTAEKEGEGMDDNLKALVLKDLTTLIQLFHSQVITLSVKNQEKTESYYKLYEALEKEPSPESFLHTLIAYYKQYGCGNMNRYKAFKWQQDKGLIGISECDPITLKELIGCNYQKEALIKNTENFLQGKPANNALLFGDSGTGKSSMVKALLNAYYDQGIRIIDLSKADFMYFNRILPLLRNRGLHYIIFLDDLSFEEFETEYKYMKALIEGGVEVKPNNVLIYATSNRRHLIRETWEERQGQDIHITDTRQEKLSLSDRFGLSLTFTSPAQNAYLEIVTALAAQYGVDIDANRLREKAIQWELAHGGRSGRVAKQFIQSLL